MVYTQHLSFQESFSSSNVQLRKAMTVVNPENGVAGDTSSLKRRKYRN